MKQQESPFDYAICDGVSATTTASNRIYHTPDGDFPSVTTILRKTENNPWLDKWKQRVGEQEAARISSAAARRGTLVHSYLERAWNGEDIRAELSHKPQPIIDMTLGLIRTTRDNVTLCYTQELPVWNVAAGYAGRLDFVGEWNGTPSVIEFKTSGKKKYGKALESFSLQSTAYALAHNALFGSDIRNVVSLVALAGGGVQIIEETIRDFTPILLQRVERYHALVE